MDENVKKSKKNFFLKQKLFLDIKIFFPIMIFFNYQLFSCFEFICHQKSVFIFWNGPYYTSLVPDFFVILILFY